MSLSENQLDHEEERQGSGKDGEVEKELEGRDRCLFISGTRSEAAM
jgi:hypothetical protein